MLSRCVLLQMVIFVGIGTGIGIAHSQMAPVKLQPDKAKPLPDVPDKITGTNGAAKPSVPEPAKNGQPAPKPPNGETPPPVPKVDEEETLTPDQINKNLITIKQAHALLSRTPPAYFIDTRSKELYEEGHVKNAWRIPLAAFHDKYPESIKYLDRSEYFVIYCIGGTCEESMDVAKQFNIMGFKDHVYVMHAGFPGWNKAGLPIETGAGTQENE